jgi:hypothetical protein
MLLGFYLFVVVALPLALAIYTVVNGLPRSRRCPRCAHATLRIRAVTPDLVSRILRTEELHRRWCMSCGWEGLARLGIASAAVRPPPAHLDASREADRVDVRRIEVDGAPWRVMVQCWAADGQWQGRLLFIGATGQAWLEAESSFRGGSAIEVLTSALAVPERALAGRLRRAIR